MLDGWYPWLVGAFVVAHLFGLAYLFGRWSARLDRSTLAPRPDGEDANGASTDRVSEDVVVCEQCETDNEAGYRFCAGCVEELPGVVTMRRSGGPASERGLF